MSQPGSLLPAGRKKLNEDNDCSRLNRRRTRSSCLKRTSAGLSPTRRKKPIKRSRRADSRGKKALAFSIPSYVWIRTGPPPKYRSWWMPSPHRCLYQKKRAIIREEIQRQVEAARNGTKYEPRRETINEESPIIEDKEYESKEPVQLSMFEMFKK